MKSGRRNLHVLAIGAAYLAASGSAIALTRFGGGAAFLWIANAVMLAALLIADRRRWWPIIGCCWAANLLAGTIWGLGWQFAPLISVVNMLEPLLAAMLMRRWGVGRSVLESPAKLGLFVLAAGILAPISTGLAGAAIIVAATGTGFATNLLHWCVGHGLGALAFTPIFAQVAGGDVRRWVRQATLAQAAEVAGLLALVALTAVVVFTQSRLPLLFLPVLPMMLVTFRAGRIGASLAVVVIATISIVATLEEVGPLMLIRSGLGERLQFLQFYLAATVLTVFPAAADLTRRQLVFERLRDSEARFRLLTDNSTDIILNLDRDGVIRYVSPSIRQLGGYDPERLVGTSSLALVDPADRARVVAVHRQALANPAEMFCVEYRGVVIGGERRWFETRTRAVPDDAGVVQGVVSVVRDTSERHRTEAELYRAAHTDPLTQLRNRRAFEAELARLLAAGARTGCVAIFDLDHFKRVNDTYGHAVGDAVLRAFARTAEAQVRSGDMLARIGGEEFGLILPDIGVDVARAACERIRAGVAALSVPAGEARVAATVSVGLAALGEARDVADAMRRADEALYVSKAGGRNRLSLVA